MRDSVKRRVRYFIRVTSLLSVILAAALWVRSYFVADVVSVEWTGAGPGAIAREVNVRFEGGVLLLQTMSRPQLPTATGSPDGSQWRYQPSRPRLDLPRGGGVGPRWLARGMRVAWRASPKGGGVDRWLTLPCWVFMLPGVAHGGWILRRRLRTRRAHRLGLCSNFGYDLRASPAKCPECGTSVAAAEPAADPDSLGDDNPDAMNVVESAVRTRIRGMDADDARTAVEEDSAALD
jgi:hypothetical protein